MPNVSLVEKFVSVQGEGRNMGRAAIFIRFAGCNLDCVFADGSICDTPWRKANEKLDYEAVMSWAEDQLPPDLTFDKEEAPMAILTGGEPTMQPQFNWFVQDLNEMGYYTAVETNGTIFKDGLEDLDWIVCSPKTNVNHNNALSDPDVDNLVYPLVDEWRWVISNRDEPTPPFYAGLRHYLSPAIMSDGTGLMWKQGFPGFVPGALERCLEIVREDPRWRLSMQAHKVWGVR